MTAQMTDAKFWDGVAEKYARSPIGNMDAYEATLARVRSYLRPTDTVLEIGCGTGTTAVKLAPFAGRYLASDISPAMIGIGRDKAGAAGLRNLGFATAPAETPPEGSFDTVLGFNLLHLLRDPDAVLAQIATRVRPGGLFISKTTCLAGPGTPLWMRALLLGLPLMKAVGKAPSVVQRFSVADLEAAITRAGFEIIETGDYPDKPPHRLIVARRPG